MCKVTGGDVAYVKCLETLAVTLHMLSIWSNWSDVDNQGEAY